MAVRYKEVLTKLPILTKYVKPRYRDNTPSHIMFFEKDHAFLFLSLQKEASSENQLILEYTLFINSANIAFSARPFAVHDNDYAKLINHLDTHFVDVPRCH